MKKWHGYNKTDSRIHFDSFEVLVNANQNLCELCQMYSSSFNNEAIVITTTLDYYTPYTHCTDRTLT